jgi:hypothetical protein
MSLPGDSDRRRWRGQPSPSSVPDWTPSHVDVSRPSAARIYDYFLGGAHNFDVDRAAAKQIHAAHPGVQHAAWDNRACLRRIVLYLLEQGVTQFLDLGSGVPTAGNVHEIAQARNPQCRVVYVDIDEIGCAHSELLLQGNERAASINVDLTRPQDVLAHVTTQGILDFGRPVGVLLAAVLHFIPDGARPHKIVHEYREALVSGSYLGITHITDGKHKSGITDAAAVYAAGGTRLFPRSRRELAALMTGLDLVDPGVVHTSAWRPEDPDSTNDPTESLALAAVGRVPDTPRSGGRQRDERTPDSPPRRAA